MAKNSAPTAAEIAAESKLLYVLRLLALEIPQQLSWSGQCSSELISSRIELRFEAIDKRSADT
jgi:hypothetical protein